MHRVLTPLSVALMGLLIAGCSDYKSSGGMTDAEQRRQIEMEAREAIAAFRAEDPSMNKFFQNSVGYAVFPHVGKGGIGIGGAYGEGVVYENGQVVGYTTLKQGTIGAQLGGQTFREIIFFQNESNLTKFQRGDVTFSAGASAVAADEGASTAADYDAGVAVFTMHKKGLMFEASIGGQEFTYTAK